MYEQYRQCSPVIQQATAGTKLQPTTHDILGPFYKADAPHRDVLCNEPSFCLSGRVLDVDGNPVAGATLDFWQANSRGEYDNEGYDLRGKVVAGINGSYSVRSVHPGHYSIGGEPEQFRTSHIHVIVTAPGHRPLTTQLYYVGDPLNATDEWFLRSHGEGRLMKAGQWQDGMEMCTFDFVLARE